MSPIRLCSSKGKSTTIASGSTDSESSVSPLVGRPRAITLGGMEGLRFPTGAKLAELNDQERSVVRFSVKLEKQEASGHASSNEMELEAEDRLAQVTKSVEETDLADKEKDPSEKGPDFRLADFLPMRLTGTDFEFTEEIDPRRSVHQRPWTPPVGYACVYESWFTNCRLWWPLPEILTTYCSRLKIALGQYIANGIRIMVALMVLAAELDITMSVRLFEELTTPTITANTGFFYGKMINEVSFEDPSVILNGYFNANIDRLGKWAQGCSDSFWEEVEAIRMLSHQRWPDISEPRIQAALNRIVRVNPESKKRKKKMGKLNLVSLPSYAASIGTPSAGQEGSSTGNKFNKRRKNSQSNEGASNVSPYPSPSSKSPTREHLVDEVGSQGPSPRLDEEPDVRSSPLEPIDQTEMAMVTGETQVEHLEDPTLEGELPEENRGLSSPSSQDDKVVEYSHLVDFHYHHTEIPFVGDHEPPARLFPFSTRSVPKMTRSGANFFGYANLMVRDYEATIKAHEEKLAEKRKSLKKKRKECRAERQMGHVRGEGEIKAQKEMLESVFGIWEQERDEAKSNFETTTKRLGESREHEVRKERLRVEAAIKQHVMSVYEKMRQYLDEQPAIQSKLVLYSQAKGL
ncbi:hypothetical protein N665_0024s0027 [Sinapis alba]|nr:hypothetical protein N665_0024s0027 [Sinapis alba]